MRWDSKDKTSTKDGDIDIIDEFLWYPVTLNGQTRWLEKASIKLVFDSNRASGGGWGSHPAWYYDDWV